MTIRRHIRDALIAQGKEILFPFVDVSGIGWRAEVELDEDETTADIVFTNASRRNIIISDVWFDRRTGKILQYGVNHGNLVF